MSDIISRKSKKPVHNYLFERNVEVIKLKEIEHLSNNQIAVRLGLTPQRISKIYNVYKDRLRPFIKEVNRG